jgi:outer membrane receptor for ferrienterochelin and colicins
MNRILFIVIILFLSLNLFSQNTDANIIGHVVCCEEHIPFVSISVKGTTIGTTTDETGHYQLLNLPEGELIIVANLLGYKTQETQITIKKEQTLELNFELEDDILSLDQFVITGDRNEVRRKESSFIVNTITPKLFSATESVTLGEGLNYCSGVRTENNCQNCGFSQVRMNGMEGSYSQILINSRPIFSQLAGVYGLELIPANMIERIEVVRGGASALYGGSAIAGTINLILKDPISDVYEFGVSNSLIGIGLGDTIKPALDYTVNFNTSVVSRDNKTGMSLYGFHRKRNVFDANADDFTELASINNTTIGSRIFHRFGAKSKMTLDFFNINEERRGGDKLDYPLHEAGIAEALTHNMTMAAVAYEQFFRKTDLFSVYASAQRINRDSYYGAEQSLSDYGNTKDLSYVVGMQYKANFKTSNLIIGIEDNGAILKDIKLGYLDIENININTNDTTYSIPHTENTIIANQKTNTLGVFSQYEFNWKKIQFSLGVRLDNYTIEDKEHYADKITQSVLSPRLSFKYNILENLQFRLSYSHGYRAPQIFDEDLHIETSGSRRVIHANDVNLKQETASSYMSSIEYSKILEKFSFSVLLEAFYTHLDNPFSNEYSAADCTGTITYTRVNAESGATVKGINSEITITTGPKFRVQGGFTVQNSGYDEVQEFSEKSFLRTPDNYGYISLNWTLSKSFEFSTTANYTGQMLVPYFGEQISNPEEGVLRKSKNFFDLGMKIRYNVKINGATLQIYTGVKNILNSYQRDFDYGINRDPGYIYGPALPRTIYFGLKIGNFLK